MRQNFDVRGGPDQARANLPALRQVLADRGIDGVFIPHEDAYQNEYLPDANERLAWVTGFTGSAGAAFVFTDRAVLFIDGRYTIQAGEQVPGELIDLEGLPEPGPFGWLSGQSLEGKTLGYDPRLMTPNAVSKLCKAGERAGARIKPLDINPVDTAWTDRPPLPGAPVTAHPLEVAGMSSPDKRATLAKTLKEQGAEAAVITSPASIAWLFNIRGGDVACSPLALSRAIQKSDGTAELYIAPDKLDDSVRAHLGNEVGVYDETEIAEGLARLAGISVSLDPDAASAWFFDQLETAGAKILRRPDPAALPRARKNAAEIAGTTRAHERDGVAVTRFLHWLAHDGQSGDVTEIDAAEKLESLREALGGLKDLSFQTISGAGPNGALPHYRVNTQSNRRLEPGSLYLVDSGGQYIDGTTDVTRTVAIGEPSGEMRRHYTLVLKGHIALAEVRFPPGTTGTHLDTLARHALWQAGLDYDHGTGHGVGVYLGVHEGPQRIARAWNDTPLMPGMIVSNEPGYYRPGAYGIRIENLQYVTEAQEIPGGERAMHGFENLTLAPLARDLIDPGLLSPTEHIWVDRYHETVLARVGPQLPGDVADWLEAACAPL